MPLTLTSLPDFVAGTLVQATELQDRMDTVQQFMNGQIGATELKSSAWVEHTHVVSSEFYGSPSRRTIGTSFHAWHRRSKAESNSTDWWLMHEDWSTVTYTTTPNDQSWSAIGDASATIMVPPIDTGGTIGLAIWCNWFAYASATTEGTFSANTDVENNGTDHIAAAYQIFVDDTGYPETKRYIHAASTLGSAVTRMSRKDMSAFLWIPSISAGVHTVSLRTIVFDPIQPRNWKHTWVGPRFFEAEIFLL